MEKEKVIDFLRRYDGPPLKLMEVCGTHTSSIVKSGIRNIISPRIKLISGPGCPVCVTPAAYIDKCVDYSLKTGYSLVTFGDMMKVPGTSRSLAGAKGKGARVEIMYSPFEVIEKAINNADITYIVAATGFETTAIAYALLVKELENKRIQNVRFLTALKTIFPALRFLCGNEQDISGFICPGHVSVITGIEEYEKLSEKYCKPFVIAGFEPEHILACIYELTLMATGGKPIGARNLYRGAVRDEGNKKAKAAISELFRTGTAIWRGIGAIDDSGLYFKDKYSVYDAGVFESANESFPYGCRCGDVITGRADPDECPMFGKECTPVSPVGPCMVSAEGACGIWR